MKTQRIIHKVKSTAVGQHLEAEIITLARCRDIINITLEWKRDWRRKMRWVIRLDYKDGKVEHASGASPGEALQALFERWASQKQAKQFFKKFIKVKTGRTPRQKPRGYEQSTTKEDKDA